VSLTDDARGYFMSLAGIDDLGDINIHFVHNDMVDVVPEGISNIGTTSLCGVQGLYNKKNILTFQGHPEFSTEVLHEFVTKGESTDRFSRLPGMVKYSSLIHLLPLKVQ
jgi:GMP synthase-like glutamine amidotransferase